MGCIVAFTCPCGRPKNHGDRTSVAYSILDIYKSTCVRVCSYKIRNLCWKSEICKIRNSNYNCRHSKLVHGASLLSPVIQFPPGSQNLVCIKGPHLILNSLRHSTNYLKYSLNQSSLHSAFIKGHMDVYVTMRSEIFAGNLKFVAKIRNPIIQLPCHSKLVYGAKLTV